MTTKTCGIHLQSACPSDCPITGRESRPDLPCPWCKGQCRHIVGCPSPEFEDRRWDARREELVEKYTQQQPLRDEDEMTEKPPMKEIIVHTKFNLPNDVKTPDRDAFTSVMLRCADSALWRHIDDGAESDVFTDEEATFLSAFVRENKELK